MTETLVICGDGVDKGTPPGALRLKLEGERSNITLRISDLTRAMVLDLPATVADLVEIATYVYAADLATSRGGSVSRAMGLDWRRAFKFVIPVREPDHWNDATLRLALCNALAFLSDDSFEFEFVAKSAPARLPEYLALGKTGVAFEPDEVLLFSGGLDSLAGAIEELSTTPKKIMLVSHRPSTKIFEHQKKLVAELRSAFPGRIMHVPVIANRTEPLEVREFTQRTRSFLYVALASAIARLTGRRRVRFYENGVVSANLPIAEQVIGTRATRTTHPFALSSFGRLLSHILRAEMKVENPFIWNTKADVVKTIVAAGFGGLVGETVSCSHVHEMSREHTHCGRCSQCIDRRFGVLAAGAASDDPETQYAVDLLEGERKDGIDRTMAEAFVRSRIEMSQLTDIEFLGRYGAEIATICGSVGELVASESGERLINLHRRHGNEVTRVIETAIANRTRDIMTGALPSSSILMMAVNPRGGPGLAPGLELRRVRAGAPHSTRKDAHEEKAERAKPVLSRALSALDALYPTGVPAQIDVSNGTLCGAVAEWLKANGKLQVSDDTVLRAAGRRN